ncbi:hypothetical protein BHAOGJBA_4469 [Methylobacterium hispanicum]|uniref:Uncharacterized protein n=1 Tax=Methylobacterium hispanicum TaxID=270350 RepID=A0AAV4ZSI3_9HYPH|nr:hypothetical protein [Methylobacterium hispanicum]GJD90925.1 hypothetical protein BHAOGJBA_4469 [Methylobacterium hispanicum]
MHHTYLTRRQLARAFESWGVAPMIPKAGSPVRVPFEDGSAMTVSATDLKGTEGEKLFDLDYEPNPELVRRAEAYARWKAPFEGVARCVADLPWGQEPGLAIRHAQTDLSQAVFFVPDSTRQRFEHGMLGGGRSVNWDRLRDVVPAESDDVELARRFLAGEIVLAAYCEWTPPAAESEPVAPYRP